MTHRIADREMHQVHAPRFICPTSAAKISARGAKTERYECVSQRHAAGRRRGQQFLSQARKYRENPRSTNEPPTPRVEDRETFKLFRSTHLGDLTVLSDSGLLLRMEDHAAEGDRLGPECCRTQAAGSLDDALRRECYFGVTALVAVPPATECTQIVVGLAATFCLNRQRPSAGLTETVPMRAPGQLAPSAAPSWISSVAAKPPVVLLPLTPSMRSSPVPRTCWARLMVTVSVTGGGATARTVSVTVADVLAAKLSLPL